MQTPQVLGKNGEESFRNICQRNRIPYKRMPYVNSYDFLVRDCRVEIKTGRFRRDGGWLFNIQRHGKVGKNQCDVFILRLVGIPKAPRYAIYMLVKAPVKTKSIFIGFRDLLQGKHAEKTNAFAEWIEAMKIIRLT